MKIWLYVFLVWMKPGSERKVRPKPECTGLICASSSRVQRLAHCSWKPYMWNHFSAVRTPWETKASPSLHRFPSALCCSRCSPSEQSRWTADRNLVQRYFLKRRKKIGRTFCKSVKILTGALWNSAFPQLDFLRLERAEWVRGILLTLLWWKKNSG